MKTRNNKIIHNILWRLLERLGAQGITFIVSIVLARILEPNTYGQIAIVTVFITILQVFVDSGLGNALIQKKYADDIDFSSVFWFNLLICTLLYILIYYLAPFVASFYNMVELTSVLRIMSIILLISGLKNVQQAYISKNLLFRKFFFSTLIGTIIAAIIGIWMAYNGYGIWALVTQNLVNQFIGTFMLWILVKWRPIFNFSFIRLRALFSYGWKLLISGLINTIYNDLRQLVIGKIYTPSDLAFYNQGLKFPSYATTAINASIDSVLFPTLSEVQDNIDELRYMTRKAIKTSTYIMMPMMSGLAACADTFIVLILTEKWLSTVFFLRIFCFTRAFYPVHTANLNAIKALGRSDIYLKIEIIKIIIGTVSLLFTMFISVKAIALILPFTSVAGQIVNSWPNKKLLKYDYLDQLKDMLPQIILSIIMFILVYMLHFIHLNNLLLLGIQIIFGICIYIIGSILLKIDSFILLKKYFLNISIF